MEFRYHAFRNVDGHCMSYHSLLVHSWFKIIYLQTPFWANNHSDMYVRVLQDELVFPDDRAIDQDTKSLIRGVNIFWLFVSFGFAHILHTASSTQSSSEDMRTTHQTASVFFHDVCTIHIHL